MRNYGFGIDIGGTTIKMGLFKVDGSLIEKWEVDTRREENGKYILIDIAKEINDKLEEKGIQKMMWLGLDLEFLVQ